LIERPILLYDAGCRLCRFTARLVSRLDRRGELAILPLQHGDAEALLEPLPEEERLSSWRLALPDGTLVGYGVGIVPLLEAMRLTRPLGRLAARVPSRVLEAAYGFVAARRRLLGRLVPDVPPVVVPPRGKTRQMTETSRASDSTDSGEPDAWATSRSQRTDSPGA
jgi:predicted DCC family thiol-disulfide oxidoreductase YuxK